MKKIAFALSMTLGLHCTAQNIEVTPSQIDFGTVVYGQKDSVYVEVTNLSDDEIFIEDLRYFDVLNTSPFRTNQIPASIAAQDTEGFYVVYEPRHNIDHNSELVILTSGNRGAVAVDLLGSCTYPMDYYDETFNLMDEALEQKLKQITSQGYVQFGYNEARDKMFMIVDNQKVNGQGSSQNRLTRVYLGTDAVGYSSRTDLFNNYNVNTEHTFPQGFFNQNLPMRTDVHHLFPTDVNANSVRGNLRFGNVTGAADWQQGGSKRGIDQTGATVFEPRDAHKGTVARSIFYFITRYQNYGGHVSELMETTLREWSATYPPTQVEKNRNQDISEFQNNRNPFVDYPEFIDRIYNFRLEENRPPQAVVHLSHESVDFGEVSGSTALTFNLVISNVGNRFLNVSDFQLTGHPAFSLQGSTPTVILAGESVSLSVSVNPEILDGLGEGILAFQSVAGPFNIPVTAMGITGIHELSRSGVSIVPNPASQRFGIEAETGTVRDIRLYDMGGRLQKSFESTAGSTYPIADLKPGVYTVEINFTDRSRAKTKLVIAR